MVAYSFQRQFAQPILDGTKGGTIRADRRRHARPGEELQLYTGMRTRQCRLIARKTCLDVDRVRLVFGDRPAVVIVRPDMMVSIAGRKRLNAFAVFDGFPDWAALAEFWRETHHVDQFDGVHVRWLEMPAALLGDA